MLYRGVFWVTDTALIENSIIAVRFACTSDGQLTDADSDTQAEHLQKEINHKKIWAQLPHKVTLGKPFDYYPRGRVEVRKGGKVLIFCSPYICNDKLKEAISNLFGLTEQNGIKGVTLKADGSAHYRCLQMIDQKQQGKNQVIK